MIMEHCCCHCTVVSDLKSPIKKKEAKKGEKKGNGQRMKEQENKFSLNKDANE